MSQQAPKAFTIPFLGCILAILSISLGFIVSLFLEPTHDIERYLILSIMSVAVMMGIAIVLPYLIVEIQIKREEKQ